MANCLKKDILEKLLKCANRYDNFDDQKKNTRIEPAQTLKVQLMKYLKKLPSINLKVSMIDELSIVLEDLIKVRFARVEISDGIQVNKDYLHTSDDFLKETTKMLIVLITELQDIYAIQKTQGKILELLFNSKTEPERRLLPYILTEVYGDVFDIYEVWSQYADKLCEMEQEQHEEAISVFMELHNIA